MIRNAVSSDSEIVCTLAVSSGLFTLVDVGIVEGMMGDYFDRAEMAGARCFLLEHEGRVVGMAYVEPVRATDGTHELLMIAVDRAAQRVGHGACLLAHIEAELRQRGQRLLLVQTSGESELEGARAFYAREGYRVVATIPDYYGREIAMVMFCKLL